MKKAQAVVGVDLGGTSLFAVVMNPKNGNILGEAKTKTHAGEGAMRVLERMARVVGKAIKRSDLPRESIAGVGVGVPGPVDPVSGVVVRLTNLGPTWDVFPLRERYGQLLNLPVTVDNDVNVGAVGEHTFGAGQGTKDMLAIFIGTGIGGGIILDGRLFSGHRNSAGEVGHMSLMDGGPVCGCGEQGHAEALASRTAIERSIREQIASGHPSIVTELLEQKGRDDISSSIIGAAYESGDVVVINAVREAQHYLGLLIGACVNLLDPEVVVVGGGVLERMGEEYLKPVRGIAQQHYINKVDKDSVRIVVASLGDYSGAMGAAELAYRRLV